jgi:hypothetical protein
MNCAGGEKLVAWEAGSQSSSTVFLQACGWVQSGWPQAVGGVMYRLFWNHKSHVCEERCLDVGYTRPHATAAHTMMEGDKTTSADVVVRWVGWEG